MTRRHLGVGLSAVSILVVLLSWPGSWSAQTSDGEWRAYAGDVRATKYSPLDQSYRSNVSQLRIAWRQSAVPVETRVGGAPVNVPGNDRDARYSRRSELERRSRRS